MKKPNPFKFNANGVCQNPEIVPIKTAECPVKLNVCILLAQANNGRWAFGFHLTIHRHGRTRRPSAEGAKATSSHEALIAALTYLESCAKMTSDDPAIAETYRCLHSAVKAMQGRNQPVPLFPDK